MPEQNPEFKRSEGVIASRPFHDYITGSNERKAAEAKGPTRPRIRLQDDELDQHDHMRRRQGAHAERRPFILHAAAQMEE